jgi:argininosuccinate lyase
MGAHEHQDVRSAYRREVLAALFDALKHDLFGELIEASRAHVVALAGDGLIGTADARGLLTALDALDEQEPAALTYDPDVEDLYFYLERHLASRLGADAAGNLQLARSRNDLDAAVHRMMARRKLLALGDAIGAAGAALAERAREGRGVLIVGRTHGAPAQPTTLGHVLTAYLDTVLRDLRRLRAAYETTNRSPLGACAFAGTTFPLDRELLARRLGFDGLVQNTYDAVVAADFVLEGEAACAIALSQASRFIETLRAWGAEAAPPLRLDAGLVQISSMMPQKRNLVFAEHLRSRAARAAGTLMAALAGAGEPPFEDDNRSSLDLIAPYDALLDETAGVFRVLALALDTAEVGVGAAPDTIVASGATTSEVMDTLVRRCGLPQRQAHRVVSAMVDRARDPRTWTGETLRQVGHEVTGRHIDLSTAALQEALAPGGFVQNRKTAGGPAAESIDAMLERDAAVLDGHREWLRDARQRLEAAHTALHAACQDVTGGGSTATSRC